MNTIKCLIEGCLSQHQTEAPVTVDVRFICKKHDRRTQVEAVGRTYNPAEDESDGKLRFDGHQFHKKFDSFAHLRPVVGGDDPFITGNQIVHAQENQRTVQTPDWMFSDTAVGEFIEKLFPNRDRNHKQYLRAMVYAGVILYWFRMGWTDGQVEEELNLNGGSCGRIVQDIRLASEGRRRDGRPRTGNPRGRPKKPKFDAVCVAA